MFETIVALATAPIKSALAIVRLSGDDCFNIVSKCSNIDFTKYNKKALLVGKILDQQEVIDEVVFCVYKGPKSFTGEDSIEIICHGSNLISHQIIELLIKNGARLATNGEYSSRSFLHHKMDLIQAESINDLINATTVESKKISMFSLEGSVSKLILPIKEKLADIISLIEVNIDFPEYEDIEVANKDKIIQVVDDITNSLIKLIDNANKAKIIKDGINVAIVGKPNVGKSSLLNCLLGKQKAIVSEFEGTTRDVVEGNIVLDGIALHLLDTAGIRKSNDKIELIGINKSIETLNEADLVIVVLDASTSIDEQDEYILKITEKLNRIIINNKSDLINKKLPQNLYISTKMNDVKDLKKAIFSNLGLKPYNFKEPALNNARQIGLLKEALENLYKAKKDCINDLTVDLISVSIYEAYKCILEILGESNQIDISKEIFSRFCVGK